MRFFFDTSAFAKRYIAEEGSDTVLELCASAETIGLSIVCLPELTSTLCRLVRERRLTRAAYSALQSRILADFADTDICDISPIVMKHTLEQLASATLRTLDAIQLGCAIAYAPTLFVSADTRQLTAARCAGLQVQPV